jgi:hypothetical protein
LDVVSVNEVATVIGDVNDDPSFALVRAWACNYHFVADLKPRGSADEFARVVHVQYARKQSTGTGPLARKTQTHFQ